MASTIRIKRTTTSGSPSTTTLSGELAYSYLVGDQSNGGDRLYIGNQTNGGNPVVIGGKYFTDMLDHVKGTLTADSAIVTDANSQVNNILVGTAAAGLDLTTNIFTATSTTVNDLNLIFTPKADGVLTIVQQGTASLPYEDLVLNDDDVPNKAYVDRLVTGASTLLLNDEANTQQPVDLGTDILQITGGEGIDTVVTRLVDNPTLGRDTIVLTVSGEDASSVNKGIASFDATNFTVTTGNVVANNITLGTSTLSLGGTTLTLAGLEQLDVDNVRLDGNTISTTDVNGNLVLLPNGNGVVVIDELNFNASSIIAVGAATDITISLQAKGAGVIDVASTTSAETRITNVADPISGADAANKRYVDEVAQGLTVRPAARAGTTAPLPASTYDNGTLGVGATLTATANGYLGLIDGVGDITPSSPVFGVTQTDRVWLAGDLILVKNQVNVFENGLYEVTQPGDAGTPWILTRQEYVDDANEIPSSYVFVQEGDTLAGTGWTALVEDFNSFDVGVDDIIWYQFSGGGSITEGPGINIAGTTVSVDLTAGGSGLTFASGTSGDALVINPLIAGDGLVWDGTTTGILNVANLTVPLGGTGFVTATTNGIVYGNGTSALGVTAAGVWDATNSVGQILSVNATGVPTWTDTIDGGTY